MISWKTLVCMVVAAGSGLHLYQAKHRSQLLDQQIAGILNNADANRDRMRILRAEYQLLQDPGRMGDLAAQHLALAKTDAKQFVNWATLEHTVPVVIAPPPAPVEPAPLNNDVPVAAAVLPPPPPSAPAPAGANAAIATAARADGQPPAQPRVVAAAPAATHAAITLTPSAALAAAAPAAAKPSGAVMTASAAPVSHGGSGGSSPGMTRAEPTSVAFAPSRPLATQPAVVPQPVMMTTPRRYPYAPGGYAYQAPTANADAYGRGAPGVGSALGMARTMPASSYGTPNNGSNWIPNGSGG